MIELAILRLFTKDRDIYTRYKDIYNNTNQEKEIKTIYNLISMYYGRYVDHTFISKDDLTVLYNAEYPNHKYKEVYTDLIREIYDQDSSRDMVEDLIMGLVTRDYASQIANAVLPILSGDGKADLKDVVGKILDNYSSYSTSVAPEEPFYNRTIDDVLNEVENDGLQWRLKCLRTALGPLIGGTLGHVYARPEAGKTSFLHSEVTYIAEQLDDDDCVLWINNEEAPARILLRSYTACCGLSEAEVKADVAKAKRLYQEHGGHRIKLIDAVTATVAQIEAWCFEYRPRLLVIDQGDKVMVSKGGDMSTPEKLKAIYDQLREVVKKCNKEWKMDILTVGQADKDAENKRVLTLGNLDSGKTGKAGAFDYCIGIGYQFNAGQTRYISFPKNKLKGNHFTYTVTFDGVRGRYAD